MNDKHKFHLSALLISILLLSADVFAQMPVGLDALEQVEDWPIYRQGAQFRQISSADPGGDNRDGTGYLYRQDTLGVIFDQAGPGCVYRIWIRGTPTAGSRWIKFYFDEERTPRISIPLDQFFFGLQYPFLAPLVGHSAVSSGGFYCYFPFPFEKHLKIGLTDGIEPHQIAYHLYPAGTQITSYTGSENPQNVVNQWLNTSSDPKDPTGNQTINGAMNIAPGATVTIFNYNGSGSISGLVLTPNPATVSTLSSLQLKFTWDNQPVPQGNCTFGSFFGSSLGPANIAGLPVGITGNNYYCFFPMPFWQDARIEVYNSSLNTSVNLSYQITYKTAPYPEGSGYFCVDQQNFTTSDPDQDLILGQLAGHGNFAGMTVTLIAHGGPEFLYGDLRVYADGRPFPLAQGTDFDGDFNAGGYFAAGAFSLPVHGAPIVQQGSEKKICAYRFSLGDLIPFGNTIELRAEHGNRNMKSMEYSSLIYSFRRPDFTIILTDELDIGDEVNMIAHNYQSQGETPKIHYYAYPGSFDTQFFSDDGLEIEDSCSFDISIDPDNYGVRLIRRRDAHIFPQAATIYVDGDSVGIWWDGDYNNYKRWSESIFEIPAQLTQGHSTIEIGLRNTTDNVWTEYYYWIYSHVDPIQDITPPAQVSNLSVAEMEAGTQLSLSWNPAVDNIGVWCYRLYRRDEPGVQPVSQFLIAEIPLTSLIDQNLTPSTRYYYLVSAVDFSGNEGTASLEINQVTSSNYLFEAEDFLPFSASSGDLYYVENMSNYGDNWSGQHQLIYVSNNVGDFFTTLITVAQSDTYDVSGYFTKGPANGVLSISVDDVPLPITYDLYAYLPFRSSKIEFGSVYLETQQHRITYEIIGKNNAAINYHMEVDNLILTPHSAVPVAPGTVAPQPLDFHFFQNYPNPFNSSTRLQFSIPKTDKTSLTVYDLQGRCITLICDKFLQVGLHTFTWQADEFGSGIYFVRLQQGAKSAVQKVLLLK